MALSQRAALLSLAGVASAQFSSFFYYSYPASYPYSYYPVSTPAFNYPSASASYALALPTFTPEEGGSGSQSNPCGAIADIVSSSSESEILVDSELALECLQSVPIDESTSESVIDSILRMLEFQSTLDYLKNPPSDYFNDPVDLKQEITDIGNNISAYNNQYDFEVDIHKALGKAHEGHLTFSGQAYSGGLLFIRDWACSLISATPDGGLPKIYIKDDVEKSSTDGFTPSPVIEINGQDVIDFLSGEADQSSYQDPDARWNSLFYSQIPDVGGEGAFVWTPYYPGSDTTIKFDNGSTTTYKTAAWVANLDIWTSIKDGDSYYKEFVKYNPQSGYKKRSLPSNEMPNKKHLLQRRANSLAERKVPPQYPEPFVAHSGSMNIGGFFIDNPTQGEIAVLMVGTFAAGPSGNDDGDAEAQEFQSLLESFFKECIKRGTEKLVIDLRQNGGGHLILGYEMFAQLFPSIEIFGGNRFRAHDAADLLGSQYSLVPLSRSKVEIWDTQFNDDYWLDSSLEDWGSWDDLYGPVDSGDGQFTRTLRYNLSSPFLSSSETYALGLTLTGTYDRTGFTVPFDSDNVIILNDGDCASTCALFSEMAVHQAHVKTIAVGGRPILGPMQHVGGTKGSNIMYAETFIAYSDYLIQSATSQSEANQWTDVLPFQYPINADASVNFLDQVREVDEDEVALQFVNETADCRLWYQMENYFDVSTLWNAVATTAWGDNGALNESACVSGSLGGEKATDTGAAAFLRPSMAVMAVVGAAMVMLM